MLDGNEETLHIVNPRPVPWNDIASSFSKALGLRLVPYSEWLAALESRSATTGTDPAKVKAAFEEVPALRLMEFFRTVKSEASGEALLVVSLASEKAQAASSALRGVEQINAKDIERWVAYWQKNGFLPA